MKMRRRALACLGSLALLPHLARATTRDGEGRVHQLKGNLTVNGEAATAQTHLRSGDRLATGADSHAIVIIGADVHLLRENTQVNFAADAARLMEEKSINCLAVTNAQGQLVGALNTHDLMQAKVI